MKHTFHTAIAILAIALPAVAATINVATTDDLATIAENAQDNDVLVLAAGTHTLTREFTVESAVTIRGAGMDQTIIKQTGSNQRVLALNNAQAKLEHLTLTGGKLTAERGNKSNDHGGCGVLILSNGGILSHCRITGNSSTCNHNRGLGLEVHSAAAVVSHCIIDNNTVTGGTNGCYGGAYLLGGIYDHCLFTGNVGHNGGGVCIGGTIVMDYCTIAGNRVRNTTNGAGGLYLLSCGSSVVSNSVVAANFCTATDTSAGKPDWGGSSACTFVNTAFPEGVAINPSILKGTPVTASPRFLDAENGDYRQRLVSPTKDLGYYAPFDYATPQCDFTTSRSEAFTNETALSFIPTVVGAAGATTSYAWTITAPDGSTTTLTGSSPSFTPTQVGGHDVSLSVTIDGVGVTTASQPDCFLASSRRFDVATVAQLLAALDLAIDGTTISCAAGEYALTAQISLEKAISLVGAGQDSTTLRQTTSNTRVVYMDHPGALVQGFTITGARITAEGVHGCGVHIALGGGTLSECRVTDNQHKCNWTYGMGVYVISPNGLVTHCVIDHNNKTGSSSNGTNGQYGGGVYASSGILDNCLVLDNGPAQFGGGVYVAGGATLRNCTVVRNSSYGTAGNVYWTSGSAVFQNCLFALATSGASDTTAGAPEWANSNAAKATFASCLFPAGTATNTYTGGNCVLDDPVFADAPSGDFHPLAASPTRDAGSSYSGLSATDLDGGARVQGSSVDIGCYEFDPTTASCSFSGGGMVFEGTTVTFSSIVSGIDEGTALSYAWTFVNHDGTTYQYDTPDVSFPSPRGGWYDVTLVVVPAGGSAVSSSVPNAHYVCPRHIYVNGDEEHGATNLFDAVAMAIPGAHIHVEEGTYPLTNRLEVTIGITITGAGIDRTILRGVVPERTPRSLLYVNDPDALVEKLTLSGFRASAEVTWRGAVIIDPRGGTIQDCRITDNRYTGNNINHARGVGVTLNGANARVNRCVIDRNQGSMSVYSDFGGGVQGIKGVIENSLICCNTNYAGGGIAVDSGANNSFTIRNCTIADNVALGTSMNSGHMTYGGGGIYVASGTAFVRNTIFSGNECRIAEPGTENLAEWRLAGGTFVLTNGLMTPGVTPPPGAADCLSADPLFKNRAAGDYGIRSTSPARDAGDNANAGAGGLDLARQPRRVGKFVDIGAVECQGLPSTMLMLQ